MSTRPGVLAFVVLVVVLGMAVLAAALIVRRPSGPSSSEPVVLVFDVPAALEEGPPPARPFYLTPRRRGRYTLYDVVEGLRRAADDDHVASLVLHIDGLEWGWAKVFEVREAVQAFRASGKPVYASLTGGGEREYLLASAARKLAMPPTAELQLDGLVASALYFRGTFDKFGVSPNFAHVGRFKSAVEPYTRTGMSPEARASLQSVLDDLYGLLVDSLGTARRIPADSVARLIDDGPYGAGEARARGLIDTLLYDTEVDSLALRRGARRASALAFSRYLEDWTPPRHGPHVALVSAAGAIASGKSRDLPGEGAVLGSETLVEALRQARTRRNVKAIVLRIDSPGGSAQASDDLWREVERCRAEKPVVVSMSDYAASGGYYFAVAADSLLASPATLTGSIGIFGGKLNILGLYRKLGLNVETVSRGRHAGMLSPYRDFTPEEAARFQASLETFYRRFVGHVSQGRRLSEADVDSLAQGRVWTGLQARGNGLVDGWGGVEGALEAARVKARIPEGQELVVDRFPKVQRTFFENVLEELLSGDDDDVRIELPLPPVLRAWLVAARFPVGEPIALMPFSIDVR